MRCPYCNAEIEEGDLYCGNCGMEIPPMDPMPYYCPNCGTLLEPGTRFCPACGAEVGSLYTTQEPAAEHTEDISSKSGGEGRFLPRWALLLIIIAACAVVAVVLIWRFVLPNNREEEKTDTLVIEEEDETDLTEGEDDAAGEETVTYELQIPLKTLEFDEAGATSRILVSTNIEDQSEITWTSSDNAVATVAEDGWVTSVAPGEAVITASWGDLTAECTVVCDFTEDNGEYLCSYSSDRIITATDLAELNAGDYGTLPAGENLAQMIINEIYAKHGYQFSTPAIQAYFEQKDWYREIGSYNPDQEVIVKRFNSIEKANVDFLAQYVD